MSTILAIETSTELASVALLHQRECIVHEALGVNTHSQTILPMVQILLAQAGISLSQCDALAFGAGPGSFTGVRTACGVTQGLAYGADLAVVPVITLHAMAQACREACGAENVLVVLDARMEEVYWAQYRYQDGWRNVIEPQLSTPSAVAAVAMERPVTVCGNALTAYASAFDKLVLATDSQPDVMPHARQIAHLAQIELAAGRTVVAQDAQPIYLRNKVAFTTAERLAKAAA